MAKNTTPSFVVTRRIITDDRGYDKLNKIMRITERMYNAGVRHCIKQLNELKKEKMILRLPNSGTRNLFVAHLESNNMSINDFNVILEVANIATIMDLIRRDFGVSILARSVCLDELKKGKIVTLPVENLSMMREINIAYPADFTQFELLRDLVKSYNDTLKLYK